MSCSNATCVSLDHAGRPLASVPDLQRPGRFPLRQLARLAEYPERRRLRRDLLEHDSRLFADIGLSRHEVAGHALRPSRKRKTIGRVGR